MPDKEELQEAEETGKQVARESLRTIKFQELTVEEQDVREKAVNDCLKRLSRILNEDFRGYRSEIWDAVNDAIGKSVSQLRSRIKELEADVAGYRQALNNETTSSLKEFIPLRAELDRYKGAMEKLEEYAHQIENSSVLQFAAQAILAALELAKDGK